MRRGVWQKVTLGVLAVSCAVSVTGMWDMRQVHASEMESVGASEQEENIPITAEYFPDENFRNYLSEKVDVMEMEHYRWKKGHTAITLYIRLHYNHRWMYPKER